MAPPVPFTCPPAELDSPHAIVILHPPTQRYFLTLCTREYPIAGGGLSGISGILMILIIDACKILTGLYQARHTLHYELDNSIVTGDTYDMVPPGRYYLHVEDLDGNPLEYGLYKNFDTWRPPTRGEVPAHWFTESSPQSFANDYTPPWAGFASETRGAMQSLMSEKAKHDDNYRCAVTRLVSPTTIEAAHEVPVEKKGLFFKRNLVDQLCPRIPLPTTLQRSDRINDIRNYLSLDCHIRSLWDTHILVFYPLSPGQYIAYFIGDGDGHANQYHFAQLLLPLRSDPYLLFVRFALAVFHYKGDIPGVWEPRDALPEIKRVTEKKKKKKENQGSKKRKRQLMDDEDTTGDEDSSEGSGEQMDYVYEESSESEDGDSESESDDGPLAFKLLSKEAEAQGMELSEEMESLVGSYHPDRQRIAQTAAEYLARNPAVGLPPSSVLDYPVFRIS
ncbi:hypothetical protein BDP27DRAFT_1353265 [Rhodocollybia butyracea]|uniref:HNH nuclease domain-containing protein n=1 Tax=Rhodocollybia butyracea TaxID=206335 RepID=A0A9P5P3A0_9AGAR|nr:hypothetical protein BDP27DRAFT_1353265 [Rhodocollybia butyracea]